MDPLEERIKSAARLTLDAGEVGNHGLCCDLLQVFPGRLSA
jgi:hypothetical protein